MPDKPVNSKQRALVIGLIFIGLVLAVFFGLRTFRAFRQFRGHRPPPPPPFGTQQVETDVNMIRDWMTIPFISQMYQVPPNVLFEALGIRGHRNQEKSLKQLNDEYYPQAEGVVLKKIKAAVLANQPPPTPTAPATPAVP